jgi:NAD(P)H-hydrate epimerase
VLVMKGAPTVVASPTGAASINPTGNPGMATAGMGDVLTGVIAGLSAQGFAPPAAARLGVCLHAAAGDEAAADGGERGLLAGDLLPQIRRLGNPSA